MHYYLSISPFVDVHFFFFLLLSFSHSEWMCYDGIHRANESKKRTLFENSKRTNNAENSWKYHHVCNLSLCTASSDLYVCCLRLCLCVLYGVRTYRSSCLYIYFCCYIFIYYDFVLTKSPNTYSKLLMLYCMCAWVWVYIYSSLVLFVSSNGNSHSRPPK